MAGFVHQLHEAMVFVHVWSGFEAAHRNNRMTDQTQTILLRPKRNDRDIWHMIERNPSIAYKDEIIAYDILAEEKRREKRELSPMSHESQTIEQTTLIADIESMSDNQLLDRAAHYNAGLRRGRKLVAEGQAIIDANINLFVICQNELHARTRQRIERETDRECLTNG